MPLPGNGVLTLQGHSRPGDTIQSKPKQAMIVRMSAKALESLNASPQQPPMDFEFGENPGIHIGDKFFPVRPLKENLPHELYLRASSAAKPMAPLKLYAFVTGKISVERDLSELDEDTHGGVSSRAVHERKERDRKAWPTETIGTVQKQRKPTPPSSSMFRKPVLSADRQLLSNPHASPSRVPSPIPTTHTARESLSPLRKQLIHALALEEQGTSDIVRRLGGPETSPSVHRDILILLKDVAEHPQFPQNSSDATSKMWRLKTRSWLEVRPYEWPGLTEQNKTSVARSARLALSSLGVPENDEAWDHVRYRNSSGAVATPPTASTSRPIVKKKVLKADGLKRSILSSKDKAAPSKKKGEVMAKDEGNRTQTKAANDIDTKSKKATQVEDKEIPSTTMTRRLPGSGFKVTKTSQPASPALSSAVRKPAVSADISLKDKEYKGSPARSGASTPQPSATHKGKDIPSSFSTTAVGRVKTLKDRSTDSDLDKVKGKGRDKEPAGHHLDLNRTKGKTNKNEPETISTGSKRKRYRESDREVSTDFGAEKRRKTDDTPVQLSSKEQEPRPKDLSLPKKPEIGLPPRPKTKKEPSPPTAEQRVKQQDPPSKLGPRPTPKLKESPPPSRPVMTSHTRSASHSSSTPSHHRREPSSPTRDLPAKANGSSSRQRRKSPIYTSSDEDEDVRPSKQTRREAPSTSESSSQPSAHDPPSLNNRPKAETTLRERYRARYPAYITAFQQIIVQEEKARALEELRGDKEYIMYDDPDVMSDDEYEELLAEHDALRAELEQIREEHAKLHGYPLAA